MLIIQEYIETDYDMRVLVSEGEVAVVAKREVMVDDVRSNVSMGALSSIELTSLENQN